jgi:hypothetical protein
MVNAPVLSIYKSENKAETILQRKQGSLFSCVYQSKRAEIPIAVVKVGSQIQAN